MPVFELEDVKVAKQGKPVLEGMTWRVEGGRITTVLGPSGSGKTSLLRLLNRLDDPSAGRVLYKDRPIETWDISSVRREVGMVFQRPELFEGTVESNLLYGPNLHGLCIEVAEIMSLIGLDAELLDQDASTLSAGQAQRVSIGRALAVGPQALLLDEPTSGLDPTATYRIEAVVRRLVESLDLTCVFVTHDIEQARRIGDTAMLIIDGMKVEEGPMAEVLSNPRDPRTLRFIRGELG
jgi:putative ABC transport system ATP-binding protein